MIIIAYVLLVFGCFISVVNFYLSFLRYPVYRLLGGLEQDYCWVSGIPVVGSLVIFACLPFIFHIPGLFWGSVLLAALDTGGLHWFLIGMCILAFRGEP